MTSVVIVMNKAVVMMMITLWLTLLLNKTDDNGDDDDNNDNGNDNGNDSGNDCNDDGIFFMSLNYHCISLHITELFTEHFQNSLR